MGAGKVGSVHDSGPKNQEGVEFDFSSETFGQIVRNFSRTYSERRLPLDFPAQQAIRDSDLPSRTSRTTTPWPPSLEARWSRSGPKIRRYSLPIRPSCSRVSRPSSHGLPDVTDCGGGSAGSPAGESCLPNVEQLSPSSKDDQDEAGNPHQVQPAERLRRRCRVSKRNPIEPSKRLGKDQNERSKAKELLAKLAKHGLEDQSDSNSSERLSQPIWPRPKMAPLIGRDGLLYGRADHQARGPRRASVATRKPCRSGSKRDADSDPATQKLVAELTGKMGDGETARRVRAGRGEALAGRVLQTGRAPHEPKGRGRICGPSATGIWVRLSS